ncbi:MAG: hypothetical protein KDE09_14595 [Anaerolineales bacterium]|nr:hypothetical protein [Anaerolineales bacterium]MCB0019014.1 hypothetical protein [Anaerolineales bacterium]MCB0031392.1 hypothetical protein [Anaerolineales bacterium]MCB8961178.1 hypothetical protein [Ardenticatenales bacterium]
MKETWQTFFETFMLPQEPARRVIAELRVGFLDHRWVLPQKDLQPNLEGAIALTDQRLMVGWIDGRSRQVLHLRRLDFLTERLWQKSEPELPYQAVLGSNLTAAVVLQTAAATELESTMLSDLLNEAFTRI